MTERFGGWLRPATYLGGNALTLAGVVITTSTALTLIGAWLLEVISGRSIHPYSGIVLFLILPALFVVGLLLIPIGVLWQRRRQRTLGQPVAPATVDLRSPRIVRAASIIAALTAINVAVLGTATSKGVEYLDSSKFCGTTCHYVMQPDVHGVSRVASRAGRLRGMPRGTRCGVVRRIEGCRGAPRGRYSARQLFAPDSRACRRSARRHGYCGHCHSTSGFTGDRLAIRPHYGDDEKNTPAITVLTLKVGGFRNGARSGIHGVHQNPDRGISYVSDPARQTIGRVSWTDAKGTSVEFVPEDAAAAAIAGERRPMDCTDCHNRAGHAFQTPERAVDGAIAAGRISSALPSVRQQAVAVLKASYPDQAAALRGIESSLDEAYRRSIPTPTAMRAPRSARPSRRRRRSTPGTCSRR